jgi:hypothetical protein
MVTQVDDQLESFIHGDLVVRESSTIVAANTGLVARVKAGFETD